MTDEQVAALSRAVAIAAQEAATATALRALGNPLPTKAADKFEREVRDAVEDAAVRLIVKTLAHRS